MSLNPKLARHLVEATLRLNGLRLWEQLGPDETLLLEIPDLDRPVAVTAIGHESHQFGVLVLPGGLDDFLRLVADDDPEVRHELTHYVVTVDPLRDIPAAFRAPLEAARWRSLRDSPAPCIIVKPAGRHGRAPRNRELRTMLYAASALIAAHESGVLASAPPDGPGDLPLLTLSGPPHRPKIEVSSHPPARARTRAQPPADAALPESGLRVVPGPWRTGIFTLNTGIKDDPRTARALLLLDDADGKILTSRIVLGHGVADAVRELTAYATQSGTLPGEIRIFGRSLYEAAAPLFEARGVACVHDVNQPVLEAAAQGLNESVAHGEGGAAGDDATWQMWHESRQEVDLVLERHWPRDRRALEKALGKYFGTAARGRRLLESERGDFLAGMFSAWLLLCYRAQARSKTRLEKLLAEPGIPAGVRAVAEAIAQAHPSLYTIERLDPPHLHLLDVATGERHVAYDRGLSGSANAGLILPALLYPAGPFLFLDMIGDFISALESVPAFEALEKQGIEVSAESLARHNYFGGRLAAWAAAHRTSPEVRPKLVNYEGEAIALQTAEFTVRDVPALLAALAERDDLDATEPGARWVWLRQGPTRHGPGQGATILGNLERFDDRLVLEVNSQERLGRARAWLEAIPGVEFLGARERDLTGADLAPDDLPSVGEEDAREAIPPEAVRDVMIEFQRNHLRTWADIALPALGGRTPRDACRTAEGRRKVGFMLRTMPPISPEVPAELYEELRDGALRDLGLA